jgi:23S rRNA (uracil1939-C5)-methyltransferase
VRDALAAHGLAADFRPIHVSPPATRRRATLTGRRLKSGALVGFHTRASDTVVEVPECRILHPAIQRVLPGLGDLVLLLCSRKAELSFALTVSEAGVDLEVRGGKPVEGSLFGELAAVAHRLKLARLTVEGEIIATLDPPVQRFGRAEVIPPPGAFLQATKDGELALLAAVSDAVGNSRRIADLFSGCGTFALPLAQRAEVHAVEGSAGMLAALGAGWRAENGLSQLSTETRDLFRRPLLADELSAFGAVVIDPPRAGAQAQTRELAKAQVAHIAAVSCNPATFARDARTLTDFGYNLNWVQVVDQFRWSAHVELVAAFSAPHIAT